MSNLVFLFNDFATNVDFYEFCKWLIIIGASLGVLSICITAIVYGYPKIKLKLILFWALLVLGFYFVARQNYQLGVGNFSKIGECIKSAFIVFSVIIGLYAAFFVLVLLICIARWHTKKEVTATLCGAIGEIEEFKINQDGHGVNKLKTEKLCVKKPRLDDKINYFKLEEYVAQLKSKPTPAVVLAEIEFCERVIKHLKNTIITEATRYQLNEVTQSLVKIGASLGCEFQ